MISQECFKKKCHLKLCLLNSSVKLKPHPLKNCVYLKILGNNIKLKTFSLVKITSYFVSNMYIKNKNDLICESNFIL